MKHVAGLLAISFLFGCNARAIAVLETGDAVIGEVRVEKNQQEETYNEKQDNILGTAAVVPPLQLP